MVGECFWERVWIVSMASVDAFTMKPLHDRINLAYPIE